jgi:membrane-bound lytic murein transglycosylase MltF
MPATNAHIRRAVIVVVLLLTCGCGKEPSSPAATPQTSERPAAPQAAPAQPAPPAAGQAPVATGGQAAPAADAATDESNDPLIAAVLRKWSGDLDGMIERRFIRVLTTYSKTNFFVDKGSQLGLIVEAFRMFEDDLNKRLENKHVRVRVLFVPVANDELIPALIEGRGDVVAAGKVITAWRKEQVDFTNPTQTGISTLVVTGPGVPPVATAQDLAGHEVYVRASDVSAQSVERFNSQLAAAGKPPVKIRPAPEELADEDLLEMVNAGLVPMTLADDYVAKFWKQVFPGIVLNTTAAVRTDAQTGMMVRKNSPQLMAELNAFIGRNPEGSLQRNVLLQKYLKSVKYARPATSREDVAKFRRTVDFLRKYSAQYKLDYLLMAAQGYQESGLDQNKKSAVGAIGVMQVMPATGAEMKVGDIKQLESNVHAGVKYIRFMMDHYYANEPMTDVNKGLFTFASYNAGPGRINQLRDRAAKRGLDPNKWFNNVEILAAESIGRETVQYVSNIYKYYLAYKMLSEQAEKRSQAKRAT